MRVRTAQSDSFIKSSLLGAWLKKTTPLSVGDSRVKRIDEAEPQRKKEEKKMGAITTSVIAIVGVVLGWIAIEIACKPCLEQGRQAIDRSLNPEYDPDDDIVSADISAPLNPPAADLEAEDPKSGAAIATSSHSNAIKAV